MPKGNAEGMGREGIDMRTRTVLGAGAIACLAGTASAQVIAWDNGAGGNWGTASNWSPANVPDSAAESASIALGGVYEVVLDVNVANLGGLSLTNPDATLSFNVGRSMSVVADVDNDGLIVVNPLNQGLATSLLFNTPGSLGGTGGLRLAGIDARSTLTAPAGVTITHGADHTITGVGRIEADLDNRGTVLADTPGSVLDVRNRAWTNDGVISAVSGGTLAFSTMTITNAPGRELLADGGDIRLSNTTLIGGTIRATAGSEWRATGNGTFDGVASVGDGFVDAGRTLDILGSLDNAGTITVNPNNLGLVTALRIPTPGFAITGAGEILLAGIDVRSIIQSATAADTVVHSASHTIRGQGTIRAALTNDGLISADQAGQALRIDTYDVTNNGRIEADGGTAVVVGVTITQSGSGIIDAGSSTVQLNNATIRGGTVEAGAGTIEAIGNATLDDVTLNGDLNVSAGRALTVESGLANSGVLTINPANLGLVTSITFADGNELSGTGAVVLAGVDARAIVATVGAPVTLQPPQTIRGTGTIRAELINNSSIEADLPGTTMLLDTNRKVNNGVISVATDSTLRITGVEIDQSGGGIIRSTGGAIELNGGSINGGTIAATSGGTVTAIGNTTFTGGLVNTAPLVVQAGRLLTLDSDVTNDDVIDVNPLNLGLVTAVSASTPVTIGGGGEIRLTGVDARSNLLGAGMTIGADQTVSGIGTIATPLTLDGTLAAGLSVGTLRASQPVTMTETGVLQVEVEADNAADLVDSTSTFHADGTIEITFVDGFDPDLFWNAPVVEASAGVSGRFDQIIAPTPPNELLAVRVRYLPTEIRVGAVCKIDFDFNGQLDFFDVSTFLALFNAQDPDADLDSNGQFDFFDISAFLRLFSLGCPS